MNLTTLIILSTAVMMFLALGIVLFVLLYQRRVIYHQQELKKINEARQLELLKASIQGEEGERKRIAAELHDNVGATLSSLKLFLSEAIRQPETGALQQSKELLDESIKKIRSISHKLQPSLLEHLGLEKSLEGQVDLLRKSDGIKASFDPAGALPVLPVEKQLATYRVFQELINNTIKHALPTVIQVETGTEGNEILVLLRHNGRGLTQEAYEKMIFKNGAIGLKNIVNRLTSVHGRILYKQESDRQFSISIFVPFAE